ncbi:MAG: hypothetical protein ACYC61_03115 [Isosphaeraceae bacterium]
MIRVWLYLFAGDESDHAAQREVETFAQLAGRGDAVFLRLSVAEDARFEDAPEGEQVYLCTRNEDRLVIRGEAALAGQPVRGESPPSMIPLYGSRDHGHWWRRLKAVRFYDAPREAADLGLDAGALPATGETHVVRVNGACNGAAAPRAVDDATSPLDRLTAAMDAAWDEGRMTAETVDAAVRRHRAGHPYVR